MKKAVKFLKLLLDLDSRKRVSARTALTSEFLYEEEKSEEEKKGDDS